MKTSVIILAAALALLPPAANAQNKKDRGDRPERPSKEEMIQMQSRRMAESLQLEESQTEKFTQLYTAFKNEIREAGKDSVKPSPELSDEEMEAAILSGFALSRKILDIREAYYPKFREILSVRQTQKMYMLENERGMGAGRPGGPGREGFDGPRPGRDGGRRGDPGAKPGRFETPEGEINPME